MPNNEFLAGVPGEVPPTTPDEVRACCLSRVDEALEDIKWQLDVGAPMGDDNDDIGHIIAEKIGFEISDDNLSLAEVYIDMLVKMPGVRPEIIAEACAPAIIAGSQYACERLDASLVSEKEGIVAAIERGKPVIFSKEDTTLQAVVGSYEKEREFAGGLIGKYGATEERQWELRFKHLGHMAGLPGRDGERYRSLLNGMMEQLFDEECSPGLIFKVAGRALRLTSDPSMERRLVSRFIEASVLARRDDTTLEVYVDFATTALMQSSIPKAEIINAFGQEIEIWSDRARDPYHDPHGGLVRRKQLPWRIESARVRASSPDEFIDVFETEFGILFDSSPDDAYVELHRLHDAMLAYYAQNALASKDFVLAKLLTSHITSMEKQSFILNDCFSAASTAEEVKLLTPHSMTREIYADFALLPKIADARVKDSPADIEQAALEHLRRHDTKKAGMWVAWTQSASDTIHKGWHERSANFLRQILEQVRAIDGIGYADYRYLSNRLIKSGDTAEPIRAYADICNSNDSEADKLTYLWHLAEKITPSD